MNFLCLSHTPTAHRLRKTSRAVDRCELLQQPNGDGLLRYAAAAGGGMQLRGEILLKRGGGARVALFQEAAAQVPPPIADWSVASFYDLSLWS
eukprot:s657_g4.t1